MACSTPTPRSRPGYDFLADGATDVNDALDEYSRSTLIDDKGDTTGLWTAADANAGLAANPDIASLNAHFDHQNLLSSFGNVQAAQDDVLNITELAAAYEGMIVFSMGCHAALNAPDTYGGARRGDWADTFAENGTAVFVGNTGYGYGDFKTVALSERLMKLFAAEPRRPLRRRPGAGRGQARLLPHPGRVPGLRREGPCRKPCSTACRCTR